MFLRIVGLLRTADTGWLNKGALLVCVFFISLSGFAQGPTQNLQGRIVNGTTGKPAAKVQVNYVLMQQGPTPLSTQTTDAEGKFHFDNVPAPAGPAPALLRAEYQGATYTHAVLPGQSAGEIEMQVYEAAHQAEMVSVKEHAMFFHPSGNTLLVLEQIVLANDSQPPKTYVNAKGTYPFTLPKAPREGVQVTVQAPQSMPIKQPPIPRDKENSFAITYPIRPGETQVRLEYALDYKSPYELTKTLDVLPKQMVIVTPNKDVQLTGDGLTPLGSDPSTGFTGYQVTPTGNAFRVQIAGDVPQPAAGELQGSGDESSALMPIANPVSQQRWLILSAAALVMIAGFVYHLKRA